MSDQVGAIRAYLDRTVDVGPEQLRAASLQARLCARGGVAVRVAEARADDRDARAERGDERIGSRRPAAVVSDLEHVELAAGAFRDAISEKVRVDLLLDVAGEQHPPRAEAQVQDDRDVIDGGAAVGWSQRHFAASRPLDVELDAVEPQPIAGSDDSALAAELASRRR